VVTTEQLHSAAKTIRADGIEGIQTASQLVGRDIALGMLILFLRMQHNKDGGWPDLPDTTGKVNEILAREGLLGLIVFSPIDGHGVVYDNETVATHITTVENMYQPLPASGVHLGMWMQGPSDYRTIPAGPYPFKKAYDEMRKAHRKATANTLRRIRKQR
jgi:hypothetical protein